LHRELGPIISDCGAIENKGRQNSFRTVLQSESAALRVIAAARRTLLGDKKTILPRDRRLGSHDSLKPEEVLVRLSTNHTFYSGGCDGYWHFHLFYVVTRSKDHLVSIDQVLSTAICPFSAAVVPVIETFREHS
jgi:hypothetical protein